LNGAPDVTQDRINQTECNECTVAIFARSGCDIYSQIIDDVACLLSCSEWKISEITKYAPSRPEGTRTTCRRNVDARPAKSHLHSVHKTCLTASVESDGHIPPCHRRLSEPSARVRSFTYIEGRVSTVYCQQWRKSRIGVNIVQRGSDPQGPATSPVQHRDKGQGSVVSPQFGQLRLLLLLRYDSLSLP
jgi:hypothetical protein